MRSLSKSWLGLAAALALMSPVAALAQDNMAAPEPATLVMTTPDGTETEYQVLDVGVYVSTTEAYEDVPASTDFSVSVTIIGPVDAGLLEWISQAPRETEELRDITIIATAPGTDGAGRELRYEISGAHITSFSATHASVSAQGVMMSILANTLSIDGVPMT